jgi:hypothetical protein
MVALAGLLVAAYLARGHDGQAEISLSPRHAHPGQTVTVQYAQPRTTLLLTFAHAGHVYEVAGARWLELPPGTSAVMAGGDPDPDFDEVTLPGDVKPGAYQVCSSGMDPDVDLTRVRHVGDLLMGNLCTDLVVDDS